MLSPRLLVVGFLSALSTLALSAACNFAQEADPNADLVPETKKKSKPSTPEPVEEKDAAPAVEETPGVCDLKKSGISFTNEGCGTCMQAKCCTETRSCVKTDPNCLELQKCLVACPRGTPDAGGGGAGGGGGGGGGDGGGGRDGGGASCSDTCNAKYPTAITGQKAYNDCATTLCNVECM